MSRAAAVALEPFADDVARLVDRAHDRLDRAGVPPAPPRPDPRPHALLEGPEPMNPVTHLAPPTAPAADPVDLHLSIARDTLKERVAELADREIALRNELDQVIGDRTRAACRLTDLDSILVGLEHAPGAVAPAKFAVGGAVETAMTRSGAVVSREREVHAKKIRSNAASAASASTRSKSEQAQARWQPVFEWVAASKADGSYSKAALSAKFGSWAKNWAAYARQFGITVGDTQPTTSVPPATSPAPPAPQPAPAVPSSGAKPGEMHLECTSCEATFPTSGVARLNSHCRLFHSRSSTNTERTPIPAG